MPKRDIQPDDLQEPEGIIPPEPPQPEQPQQGRRRTRRTTRGRTKKSASTPSE